MDGENVFGQLRRIARNIQKERALAEERMSRPLALRSSGDSARPVLRRMQADAHNVKIDAGKAQYSLPPSSDFKKLLDCCSQLCDAYKSQASILEGYLQQYGYQPQPSKAKAPSGGVKKEVPTTSTHLEPQGDQQVTANADDMKENVPTTPAGKRDLGSSWKGGTPRLEDFGLSRGFLDQISKSKHQASKDSDPSAERPQTTTAPDAKIHPTTPAKNPDITVMPVTAGTPKLEDFGLSSNFLESISKKKLQSHHGPKSTHEGAQTNLCSTFNEKQMEKGIGFTSNCPFTPVGVTRTPSARVTVTPGMFGGADLPDETPTKFVDMASGIPRSHIASPMDDGMPDGVKKSLHFEKASKKGASSVLDSIPSNLQNDNNFGTPQPPEMTARWNFHSVQAPLPYQPGIILDSDKLPNKPEMLTLGGQTDTPPTPEMTAKWNIRMTSKLPTSLPPAEPPFILEQPIRLTSNEPTKTPEEPERLCVEKPAPSLDEMPQTPPGFSGKVGSTKSFDFSRFTLDEMPKTPELTMSYPRYVDPGTKAGNISKPAVNNIPQKHSANLQPDNPPAAQMGESKRTLETDISYITMVTDEEFSKQSAHMKRILPLHLVNETASYINTILNIKRKDGKGVFLTDEDVQVLNLGPKSKAMLLFFFTIERLTSKKQPGSSEVGYYPVM